MTSIAEISDEPKFTIKAVCDQTGILPVTLRAWERRHAVLKPHRSENRYRLYSEQDVAILLWLKNRLDSGITISVAANELHGMLANNVWPEAVLTSPATAKLTPKMPPDQYAKALYNALIHHDEVRAGELSKEIFSSFGLMSLCTEVLSPALVLIGEDWYTGRITVTTEHFASAYIRGKLLAAFQNLPTRRGSSYILVGCGPDEQHEIGALMIAALLRSEGYRVEYLGPDVPVDDLIDYARYEHPHMIVLASSMESSAIELKNVQEKLQHLRPIPIFGYGGAAFTIRPSLRQEVPGIFLGETMQAAIENVKLLLKKIR
jgi:methanogenic corrinoid protein MtbC1